MDTNATKIKIPAGKLAVPGDRLEPFNYNGLSIYVKVEDDSDSGEGFVGVVVEVAKWIKIQGTGYRIERYVVLGNAALWGIDDLQTPPDYGQQVAAELIPEAIDSAEKTLGQLVAEKDGAPLLQCVYPGCAHTRRTRGLCHAHYQTMRSYVRLGRASEEDLMKRGLLLPEGTGGTKVTTGHDAFLIGSKVTGKAGAVA